MTPWIRVRREKPPVAQLRKDFLTFYGTRRFFIVFTRALLRPLSCSRSFHIRLACVVTFRVLNGKDKVVPVVN
jgi:hypothetical protein